MNTVRIHFQLLRGAVRIDFLTPVFPRNTDAEFQRMRDATKCTVRNELEYVVYGGDLSVRVTGSGAESCGQIAEALMHISYIWRGHIAGNSITIPAPDLPTAYSLVNDASQILKWHFVKRGSAVHLTYDG